MVGESTCQSSFHGSNPRTLRLVGSSNQIKGIHILVCTRCDSNHQHILSEDSDHIEWWGFLQVHGIFAVLWRCLHFRNDGPIDRSYFAWFWCTTETVDVVCPILATDYGVHSCTLLARPFTRIPTIFDGLL